MIERQQLENKNETELVPPGAGCSRALAQSASYELQGLSSLASSYKQEKSTCNCLDWNCKTGPKAKVPSNAPASTH